ncbi:MAG: hypothetical protein Q8R02_15525 [Hyphomonadaceae bacterium]|nr:hypothetical protein [Hyphomonadaceae bacterium]
MSRALAAAIAALAVAACSSTPIADAPSAPQAAIAETAPPPPSRPAHPDLSGFWSLNRGKPVRDPALAAKLPADTVIVDDTGGPELPIGDYGGLKPKPEALAIAKAWKPADDMTLDKVCAPPSIIYALQGPFPIEIFQGTELIVMKLEYYDMVRIIFMNRAEHLPPEVPHTKVGDSIGRWEGDTLVVDTTHLLAATVTNNGLFHSDNARVVERFRLGADGKTLNATQEFEDPDTLENRGVRFITWTARAGDHVFPYECDPRFAENYNK